MRGWDPWAWNAGHQPLHDRQACYLPAHYQPVVAHYYPVASDPFYVNIPVAAFQPTSYTSDILAGVLDWADTPANIVYAIASVGYESRPDEAARFLGRIPAGAWEAEFEGYTVEDGRTRLHFRGTEENSLGYRPLIVLVPKQAGPMPVAGQRVLVTGRLAEICVDDPAEPAGRLGLAEGGWR